MNNESDQPAPGGGNLMGLLRCDFERHGRSHITSYKKRFWVVNDELNRLEMYKNDQAHVPQEVIKAERIKGVVYAGDKENRFYGMLVQTRMRHNVRFRMNSIEQREAWFEAISALVAKYSTSNRRHNMLQLVLRRARAVSRNLDVNILIDNARLLEDIPDDLLQYVAEAVDIGLNNIAIISRAYANPAQAPRRFTLYVRNGESGDFSGPQYDPTTRLVTCYVYIFRDAMNHVTFSSTDPDDVIRLMQSNVFRNPLIEGWISAAPGCAKVCEEIRISLDAKKPCPITFQWGKHVSDTDDAVEAYLQKFVNEDFFRSILYTIRATLSSIERLLEEMKYRRTPDGTPRAHTAAAATGKDRGGGVHFRVTSEFLGHTQSLLPGPGHHQSNSLCTTSGQDLRAAAAQLLSENITGFAISLDKKLIEVGSKPPEVNVGHAMEYEIRCRPAFLLMDKYRSIFAQPHLGSIDGSTGTLHNQLFELAFHALLTYEMSSLRSSLGAAMSKSVRVIIRWDELLRSYQRLGVPLASRDLPRLVCAVGELCVPRVQLMSQYLNRKSDHTEDSDATTFYDAFSQCISSLVIGFGPYLDKDVNVKSVPDPVVRNGALVDTLLCADESRAMALVTAVNRHCQTTTSRRPPSLMRNVYAYPAKPRLGSWCETYFSQPEHMVSAVQMPQLEDEFGSDSDASVDPDAEEMEGEVVAHERSAEIQVLNMQRAVNAIYDSQGNLVDLKISARAIQEAVKSLSDVFGGKRISKHDLVRVLSVNLHQLRHLYSRAADGVATSLLTEEEAASLLRKFCEYELSESAIPDSLQGRHELRRARSGSMSPSPSMIARSASANGRGGNGAAGAAEGKSYDFQDICHVALNDLLPLEAVSARRGWRTGFFFGLENTGKSLIVNSIRGVVRPTVPSVGLSRRVVAFEEWIFSLNELGGRESFRKNWVYYAKRMAAVHFLCFVVDSQSRRSFQEAHAYLKEVATYYKDVPLLVIFNNYRDLPRPVLLSDLESNIDLDIIRRIKPSRLVVVCTCDLTVVHSANRNIPIKLRNALQTISGVLYDRTEDEAKPLVPKVAVGGTGGGGGAVDDRGSAPFRIVESARGSSMLEAPGTGTVYRTMSAYGLGALQGAGTNQRAPY